MLKLCKSTTKKWNMQENCEKKWKKMQILEFFFAGKRGIFETSRPRDEEISKEKIVMTL